MAAGEIISTSMYHFQLDGMEDLVVKKVSGINIELQTAGDSKSYGVTKGGKSAIQATVTGVANKTITVEFVATEGDKRLVEWCDDTHRKPIIGGGSKTKGVRKTGSLVLYNQGGEEAVRYNFTGVMIKDYEAPKMEAGSTQLAIEKVVFIYENCHRVK